MDSMESSMLANSAQVDQSALDSDEDEDGDGDGQVAGTTLTDQKIGALLGDNKVKLKLPKNLLSKPLTGQNHTLLSKKEKRLYTIQKQKWQQRKI